MSTLLLSVLAHWWKPLVAGLVALAALVWFNHAAEQRGTIAERQVWQAREGRAVAAAVAQSVARATQREAALASAATRAAHYAATRARLAQEVIRYVQTPAAAVACPDAAGVRIAQAGIDAANAATAATR